MTDCQEKFDELTYTANRVLDRDLAGLTRMPDRSRIEKYNEIKADEEELRWDFGKECPDFLSKDARQRAAGELTLARLLLAASFYKESEVPTAMQGDFIEKELEAVVEFDRFKQFDALDEDQIEEKVRRMEGEVYELVQEYTSTQIANMDKLIENPEVQQEVIERLVERYDDRRERIRQGFFVYVETHGLEHLVESIEDAIEAVSDSTDEREKIQDALREELTDLEDSLERGFERQRTQIQTEISRVERQVASETVDAADIRAEIQNIDTIDEDALAELNDAISRTQELETQLDTKITELETAKEEAVKSGSEEVGEQAAQVVEAELERLTEQRSELKNEIDRLQVEREEIESARDRLDERQQSLEERVEEVETSVDDTGGLEGKDVVTASTARLFEMDYMGRFDTGMFEVQSIRMPNDTFEVPHDYWDGRSERRNEASRMTNLLQEHDKELSGTHPTNPTARYTITESKYMGLSESTEMIIEATVASHLEAHAINGFDATPADLDDLLGFVNDAVREASNQETPYLLGIASPTGWTDRVQNLVKEDELARTRFSRHVSVCLVDLRNGELIYDPADPVVAENISLFERAVQTEAVDDCYAYLKSEYVSDLGRETVMLQEITNETDYDRHVVKRSFDRVESNGDGEQFYIDEDGLAIDIG
ncbi:hypothetical protein DM826_02090 [Halonotius aquaticus]|uniref:Chromosome segregation ATPase n=1 Tax=Halonotius aquaticus TaxID=2216978 RepID=A0A3A6Q1J0_9EURY|nr:hypothetical protein [Halonotius aquaticus]RJX44430.1 hypothetical protein DM826_02090 [Halonotius aquaticus]